MQDLNYELKQLCQRNRDGSYATQVARERILAEVADRTRERRGGKRPAALRLRRSRFFPLQSLTGVRP
jgi:hypothetical protein